MKRATALKVLAGTLVLITLASAFPIAIYLNQQTPAGTKDAADATDGSGNPLVGPLPFGGSPPSATGSSSPTSGDATEGPSSLPGSVPSAPLLTPSVPGAKTGSPLMDEIIGSAHVMGYDVTPPALPVDKLPAVNPLRVAILGWVAATGSQVPAAELQAELAHADALPQSLQRDLALVVLSAAQASILQQAALAKLTPDQVAWVYAHPELADDLAKGVSTPETRTLASLAALVDMKQSIEASLLVIEAVEATSGRLSAYELAHATKGIPVLANDASTSALLSLLASSGGAMSQPDKVRLAARVIALGAHLPEPQEAVPTTSFSTAIQSLVAASHMAPDADGLAAAQERASALPADLQTAVATTIVAEAHAIDAANPQLYTPTGRTQALVDVLMATAAALPTLEKYNLYWRNAPSALRVGQWAPATTEGYALEQAALLLSARGNPTSLAAAVGVLHGAGFVQPTVPARSFVDALDALSTQNGHVLTPEERSAATTAAASLSPAARDAAAIMMSGAAESARYHRLAFASLSDADQGWLLTQTFGLDALYAKANPTSEDLAFIGRAVSLAERVNVTALAASEVVAVAATEQARAILAGAGSYHSAGDATLVPTLWDRLVSLFPLGSARAQSPDTECVEKVPSLSGFVSFSSDCDHDIVLRITSQSLNFFTFGSDCDQKKCYSHSQERNDELLLITGSRSTIIDAEPGVRLSCNIPTGSTSCFPSPFSGGVSTPVPRYGAAVVSLDLGGSDIYRRPVAVTLINATLPVSMHLDIEGNDAYTDPSGLYDALSPATVALGIDNGVPTAGSAMFGGAAVLIDALGNDVYSSSSHSEGFGHFGLGMIADLQGDDRYDGLNVTQGASSDNLNLGAGILFDASGNDRYSSIAGQGYGLGGVLLDLGGQDAYANPTTPAGAPIARLNIVPGGNLTTLDRRGDNHVWIDGPSQINLGLALDEEAQSAGIDISRGTEGIQDFVNSVEQREAAIVADADGDTFPDFIERAFGTDPSNAASYPAGFPRGPILQLPVEVTPVNGPDNELRNSAPSGTPRDNDKIVDLRVPLQDIGSLDQACVGDATLNLTPLDGNTFYDSSIYITAPRTGRPQIDGIFPIQAPAPHQIVGDSRTSGTNTCDGVGVTFLTGARGNGTTPSAPGAQGAAYTFRLPTGILAIGDSVNTKYDIDYLVAIDLGGDDTFKAVAGGATPIVTAPQDYAKFNGYVSVNNSFLAPTIAINVDPAGAVPADIVSDPEPQRCAVSGCDWYDTPRMSYTQGALFGVLVDTGGNDNYTANNVSQGAVGGVLLDLSGNDRYTANNLTQGASIAGYGVGQSSNAMLPDGDGSIDTRDAADRRSAPSLLLDLGATPGFNVFTARGNSQGFARGFAASTLTSDTTNSPIGCRIVTPPSTGGNQLGNVQCQDSVSAIGVLVSASQGPDLYNTANRLGINSQGVGGGRGVGALIDLGGDDHYFAYGPTSQGAAFGGAYAPTAGSGGDRTSDLGAGLLVDASGNDTYSYFDPIARSFVSRNDRQNQLTLERVDDPERNGADGVHLYSDIGAHLDTEIQSSDLLLASVVGSNQPVAAGGTGGFYVNLPTARLAIGNEGSTVYDKTDYALIIDLGGANWYNNTGGGFIRDAVAGGTATTPCQRAGAMASSAAECQSSVLSLFPVTLLYDVGHEASSHFTNRSLAQGAGFFSVGVAVDAGGADTYTTVGSALPAFGSQWMQRPILVPDGAIRYGNDSEWNVTPMVVNLTNLQDARYASPFTFAVANDERNLYLAIEGPTHSDAGTATGQTFAPSFTGDNLTVDINYGATRTGFDNRIGGGRSALTRVVLQFDPQGTCKPVLQGFDPTNVSVYAPIGQDAGRLSADCHIADGRFTAEIVRPLREAVENASTKRLDPSYDFDAAGFHYCTPDPSVNACDTQLYQRRDFAFRLAYHEAGTSSDYAYPAGTTDYDGDFYGASQPNGKLDDEMAGWALVRLANQFNDSNTPTAAIGPQLSQGAALAGVGILANVGTAGSDSILSAGDRSQGYANFQGLAILADGGGSDVYTGGTYVQGAAENAGYALFLEAGGNDRYQYNGLAQGHVDASTGDAIMRQASLSSNSFGASQAYATFLDIGGTDAYSLPHTAYRVGDRSATLRLDVNDPTPGTAGNDREWSDSAGGFGVDVAMTDFVQKQIATQLAQTLYGQQSRTSLFVTQFDATKVDPAGPRTSGCTSTLVANRTFAGGINDLVLTGEVCLRAIVNLQGAGSNAAAGGSTAVDSVDFALDGIVIASTANADTKGRVVTLDAVVNSTNLIDGVRTLRAITAINVTFSPPPSSPAGTPGLGSIIFYDPPASTGDLSTRKVLISNAPVVGLALDPAYTGGASAVVSAHASVTGKDQLHVRYNVSHDADEERLNAIMGWSPSAIPQQINVPCGPDAAQLCNLVPFFLPSDQGASLKTEPMQLSTGGNTPQSAGDKPYTASIVPLKTDFTITTKDGFHVYLQNHTAVLPQGIYTTKIRIRLQEVDPVTGSVRQATVGGDPNKPIFLAERSFDSDRSGLGDQGYNNLNSPFAAYDTIKNTVVPATSKLNGLDVGATLRDTVQNLMCVTAPGLCSVYHGYGFPSAIDICNSPAQEPVGGALRNTSRQSGAFCDGPLTPSSALPPLLTDVGNRQTSLTSGQGRSTSENVNATLNPASVLNWTDFWLDVNDTPALRAKGVTPTADGKGVVLPPGKLFALEIFEERQGAASDVVNSADPQGIVNLGVNSVQDTLRTIAATFPNQTLPITNSNESLNTLTIPTSLARPVFTQITDTNVSVVPAANGALEAVRQGTVYSTLGLVDNPIPIATFVTGRPYDAADFRTESRLDVRVPTEPSTNVTVRVLDTSGQSVRTLQPATGVEGIVRGSPGFANHTINWAGQSDSGSLLPDGVYTVEVATRDAASQQTVVNDSVLLDSTSPSTQVLTRTFIGAPILGGQRAFDLQWTVFEPLSGLKNTRIYQYNGTGSIGLANSWRKIGDFPPAVTSASKLVPPSGTNTAYFVAISEDRAGNVESACAAGETCPATTEAGYTQALQRKLNAGLNRGSIGYVSVTEDADAPLVQLPDDAIASLSGVGVGAKSFLGGKAEFVQAGAPVALRLCAQDIGGPDGAINNTVFSLFYVDPATFEVLGREFNGSPDGGSGCPQGYSKWSFSGWGALNTNKTTYPDGVWQAQADVYDRSGNRATIAFPNLILDGQAPTVSPQAPIYPAGQSAVKPGDNVTLRLLATDAFVVDESNIVFDTGALSTLPTQHATLTRDGSVYYEEVRIAVDKVGLVDGQSYLVTAHVPDLAGNTKDVTFSIPVSYGTFTFNHTVGSADVRVVSTSYSSVTLAWSTSVPTAGFVRYGPTKETLVDGPRNLTLSYDHLVTLQHLTPSTRYVLRAASTTAGGVTEAADIVEITTATGLYLTPISPVANPSGPVTSLSGPVPIVFTGGLHESTDLVRYTLEVSPTSANGPFSFVTTLTQGGEHHELTLNSSRYLDGGSFYLRLTAEAGTATRLDTASLTLGPFLLDNTPPTVSIISPQVATRDAQPVITATAQDNLAGFGAAPVSLSVDGVRVGSAIGVTTQADGVLVSYPLPAPLAQGLHTFTLRIADKAGNVDEETWKVVVDNAPPLVDANPTGFAPGTAAAKNGGSVTLNLSVRDASGIAVATADTSGFSSNAVARLVRIPGTDNFVGTATVTLASASASVPVRVSATDLAGNTANKTVTILVDNTPPVASEPVPSESGYRSSTIRVDTNEPVLLFVNATAPATPAASGATTQLSLSPKIVLGGLLPSRVYAYNVQAVDAAGNVATVSGSLATLVDSTPPTGMGPLGVVDLLNGTLRLSWTSATDDVGIAFYRIYRSDDGATYRPVGEVDALSFDNGGLTLEKAYRYQVVAVDFGGNEGHASPSLTVSATAVPRLTTGLATPTLGSTSTVFRYVVTYMSPGGVAPAYVHILLDGVPQNMTLVEGAPATGATYAYETRLAPHKRDDPHAYAFEANDGRYTVKFPEDGSHIRGPLVSADASGVGGASGIANFAQRVPLGGAAIALTAAVAAVAIAALVMRKKKEGSK